MDSSCRRAQVGVVRSRLCSNSRVALGPREPRLRIRRASARTNPGETNQQTDHSCTQHRTLVHRATSPPTLERTRLVEHERDGGDRQAKHPQPAELTVELATGVRLPVREGIWDELCPADADVQGHRLGGTWAPGRRERFSQGQVLLVKQEGSFRNEDLQWVRPCCRSIQQTLKGQAQALRRPTDPHPRPQALGLRGERQRRV